MCVCVRGLFASFSDQHQLMVYFILALVIPSLRGFQKSSKYNATRFSWSPNLFHSNYCTKPLSLSLSLSLSLTHTHTHSHTPTIYLSIYLSVKKIKETSNIFLKELKKL